MTAVDTREDVDLGVDLNKTVPCQDPKCPEEAVWLATATHSRDEKFCMSGELCNTHRAEVIALGPVVCRPHLAHVHMTWRPL
ncbi:hypothetical protein [Occultella kanbiaonis]|uniref:hypothetical protein n=1 Tax=Occultella kanbiaonis TaxID=2675754 RepID=UPI0013D3C844|nr:hypothetical protein [Occultella kanbiaonis]